MRLSDRAHFLIQRARVVNVPVGLNAKPIFSDNELSVYGNDHLLSAQNDNFLVLLSGELILPDGRLANVEDLFKLLNTEEEINPDNFNGSFSLQVISLKDKTIRIYTDPFNSRKVFYGKDDNETLFYISSLHLRLRTSKKLDLAGIGSYLGNGVIFGNRTVFAEVSIIPAATCHTDKGHRIEAHRYWHYRITSSNAKVPERQLLDRYKELLVRSVEVRSGYQDHHFISISGGYDSAGIAGIMQLLGRNNVSCFSYIYGDSKPGADAFVAREMAMAAGYPHQVVQSYKGDLIKTIIANGELGEGLANFCDEIDIWKELIPQINKYQNPAMFAGDMYYLPNVQPQSVQDAIASVGINPPAILWPYKSFAKKRAFNEIQTAWGRDFSAIQSAVPHYANHKDLKDDLYANYRIPHTLMVWREMIQMAHLPVMNPFLDREVMAFVMALPIHLRDGKSLYKKALADLSPHLFTQKRARENRVKPDWGVEFVRNREKIMDWVNNSPSQFDEIFPPKGIRELFDFHERNPFSIADFIGRGGRSVKYRYPFTNQFISRFIPLPPKELSSVLLLKRVLVLRAFLLNNE